MSELICVRFTPLAAKVFGSAQRLGKAAVCQRFDPRGRVLKMISQRRSSNFEQSPRISDRVTKARHAAGWALTEIILIAVIPCFSWLVWSSLSNEFQSPWLSAGAATPHGPLRTIRDLISLQDGKTLAIHRNGEAHFWDETAKSTIGEFSKILDETRCGDFSARKRLLTIGSAKGELQIWNVDQLDKQPQEFMADMVSVCVCKFTNDDEKIVTAGGSGDLKFWDPATGVLIANVPARAQSNAIHSLMLSADGQFVYAGTFNGTVYKWSLADYTLCGQMQLKVARDPDSIVIGIFELPGTTQVAVTTRSGSITIWDHGTGKQLTPLDNRLDMLIAAVLTPDSRQIIGVNEQGDIRAWDLVSGESKELRPFKTKTVRVLATSQDGSSLIGGDNLGQLEFAPLNGE
jgi:WD40 repeat protein